MTRPLPAEVRAALTAPDLGALLPEGPGVAGRAAAELQARITAPDLSAITGTFELRGESLRPTSFAGEGLALAARGQVEAGSLRLARLKVTGPGVDIDGSGSADLHDRSAFAGRVRVDPAGPTLMPWFSALRTTLPATEASAALADAGGRIVAEVDLAGPGLLGWTPHELRGQARLEIFEVTLAGEDGLPLDASAEIDLTRDGWVAKVARLEGPGVELQATGLVSAEGAEDLTLRLRVAQLAATVGRLTAELRTLGIDAPLPAPLGRVDGAVDLDVALDGAWSRPAARGELRVEELLLPDSPFASRRLQATLQLRQGTLSGDVALEGGGTDVRADLDAALEGFTAAGGTVRIEATESEAAWWAALAGESIDLEGTVQVTAELDLDERLLRARTEVKDGSLFGRPFELLGGDFTASTERIAVEAAELQTLGGTLRIDGELSTSSVRPNLRVHGTGFALSELLAVSESPLALEGEAGFDVNVTGTPLEPEVAGRVMLQDVAVTGIDQVDLDGDVSFDGQRIRLHLIGEEQARVRIEAEPTGAGPWSLDVAYPLRLDLRAFLPSAETNDVAPPAIDSGEPEQRLFLDTRVTADLSGTGLELAALAGTATLSDTGILVGEAAWTLHSVDVRIADGRARLQPFELKGQGLLLHGSGEVGLVGDMPLSARLSGDLPIASVASQVPGVRFDGKSTIEAEVGGTLRNPEWNGTVRITDARFHHIDFPAQFEQLDARIDLSPERWRLAELTGKIRGGSLNASGEYAPSGPDAGQITLSARGEELGLAKVDGLRAAVDVDLRLSGNLDDVLTLSGRIETTRAAYNEDIDLGRQLSARSRLVSARRVGSALDRVRLDLEVAIPALFLNNNLIAAEAGGTLQVGGSAQDPLVTGSIAVEEGGRIIFRGVTYHVTRGRLSWVSAPADNPTLDIEGQTTVAGYEITLRVSGTTSSPQADLRSDPPLSQTDIVSVLITGRTRDEIDSTGGGLAEGQAAAYLTDSLTPDLEKSLQRSLGLDQFTIDPVYVAENGDPTSRLTVGKALTGRTFVTYSRALSGSQDDIYQLRYEPREHVAFVGRKDEEDELSAEALYTQRRYLGPNRPPSIVASAERQEIERLGVHGSRVLSTKQVRRAIGLHPGDTFRRSLLLSGLETLRARLLERGYPEADVTSDVANEGAGVAIDVRIAEGRRVRVSVEGWKHAARVREWVLDLWQNTVFRGSIAEDASDLVERRLAQLGWVDARATATLRESAESTEARLSVVIEPGPRVHVSKITLEGNLSIDDSRIHKQMLTEERGLLTRARLDPQVLEEDREAIEELYLASGYLEVDVGDPKVEYPKSTNAAVVRLEIVEGPRYTLRSVSFPGATSVDRARLEEVAALATGLPYADEDVRQARLRVRRHYDEHGWRDVRVDVRVLPDREAYAVDVELVVTEGERGTIAAVDVAVSGMTREEVVRREIEVEPGDPLSGDKIAASRQNLYETGLFRSVTVVERPGGAEGEKQLVFEVEERTNLTADYGLGYSTDKGAQASVNLNHRNLFGRRLYGGIGARVSEVDWRTYSLVRKPRIFGTRFGGLATGFVEEEEEEGFTIRREGITLQLDRTLKKRGLSWFVGYGLKDTDLIELPDGIDPRDFPGDIFDPREESRLRLGDLNAGFLISSRDDFVWPTSGQVLQAKLSWFDPALFSEADFLKGYLQWSFSTRLGRRMVWTTGIRFGAAEPYGDSLVPISEHFFAGGDTSIRGFERDAIEAVGFPRDVLENEGIEIVDSLGGNALWILNQELVFPLTEPVFGAVFYDAGNIYWTIDDLDFADLRHSAGLGVRLRTPVGPLRLEYGWKLDRRRDESRGRLHLSVGLPF